MKRRTLLLQSPFAQLMSERVRARGAEVQTYTRTVKDSPSSAGLLAKGRRALASQTRIRMRGASDRIDDQRMQSLHFPALLRSLSLTHSRPLARSLTRSRTCSSGSSHSMRHERSQSTFDLASRTLALTHTHSVHSPAPSLVSST